MPTPSSMAFTTAIYMTSPVSQSRQNQASGFTGKTAGLGGNDTGPLTSTTLLGRLQNWDDTAAWRIFVDRYQCLFESWSRRKLANPADVDEVNQQVIWEVARRLTDFRYDSKRSFRGWLRTLHQSRLLDFLKIQRRRRLREVEIARLRRPMHVASVNPVEEAPSPGPDSEFQFENSAAVEFVLSSVQSRVSPQTWSIFNDIAVHGQSVSDTAQRHGMKYAATFAAYSRTCQMLRREAGICGVELSGTGK